MATHTTRDDAMKRMLLLLSLSVCFAAQADECDFKCTLNKHLSAIQARDYAAFVETLTRGERLTFILPGGRYSEGTDEYKSTLKNWFADTGWTLDYKVLALEETDQMGTALLEIAYDEADRNGQPYHLDHYLFLVFRKFEHGWALVHDQNTAFSKDTTGAH